MEQKIETETDYDRLSDQEIISVCQSLVTDNQLSALVIFIGNSQRIYDLCQPILESVPKTSTRNGFRTYVKDQMGKLKDIKSLDDRFKTISANWRKISSVERSIWDFKASHGVTN